MAVIDFHSHILPAIDDGSSSVEQSMQMLEMASAQHVDVMVATPHFYAARHRVEDFLKKRQSAFEKLRINHETIYPALKLGAEVAFFPGISNAERLDDLTIEGTRVLLLEMPFAPWLASDLREVRELIMTRNYQVVLAHLERYMGIAENKRRIEELTELPLYVQINAESLLGWRTRRPLVKMFSKGQAHFLGSDCHGVHRREPNLSKGRGVLSRKLGEDFLHQMDERGSDLLQLGEKNV